MKKGKKVTPHRTKKAEFDELRKVIELDLMQELTRVAPKPTLADAERLFLLAPVQEAVVRAADELRKLVIEFQNGGMMFQYRKFFVGAAGVGIIRLKSRCKWYVRTAYNTKDHQNAVKKCAEMRIMRRMHQHSAILIGMVVLGFPREEDTDCTLHPCEACRHQMRGQFRHLFSSSTRFVLVLPEQPVREGFNIEALMEHHQEA